MNQIIITFVLISASAYFLYLGFKGIYDSILEVSDIKLRNKKIKKWNRVVCIIKDLRFNCDYSYPYKELDVSDIGNEEDKDKEIKLFKEHQLSAVENRYLYGNVAINYSYSINGSSYESRTIGPFVGDMDLEMFYKLKPGSKVKIFVNPEDDREAYIRVATNAEIDNYANSKILSNLNFFGYSMVLGLLAYFSFIYDFQDLFF